jgi:hypothetical protein
VHRPSRTSSTERSAAWRARVASANALNKAQAEADLQAAIGQEAYDLFLVKRQKCMARESKHKALAKGG